MTTERYHRCAQCGTQYTFQGSGPGCDRADNNATWCPSCTKIVYNALANVQRLFECRYRSIKEVERFKHITLEQVLEWEMLGNEIKRASGWPVTRIWPGLFDAATGDSQNIREVIGRQKNPELLPTREEDVFVGVYFRLSTWRVRPEHVIEVPMEYDLIKGTFTGQLWR
jgi:hypothetical protein